MLVASICLNADKAIKVIDLGVGSGVTSAYILNNYPKAEVIGIDLFDEMLDDARARLKTFGDRVTLIKSDNTEFLKRFSGKVNVVVSAFCIHHLDEEGKKEIFRLIHNVLQTGGRFLMLDLTTFEDDCLRELARQATISHMKSNVDDEGYRAKWIHHWNNINMPHPADVMEKWLWEEGFAVETVFRSFEVALIVGM